MPVNSGHYREKRASERRPIQLSSEIIFGDGDPVKSQIEDFCAEGVYVTFAPDIIHDLLDRGLETNSSLLLRFAVGVPPKLFELALDVRRLVDGGLGGMFIGQNSVAITALLQHCSTPAPPLSAPSRSSVAPTATLLLRQCERIIINALGPLLEQYVTVLPDGFDALIAQTQSDSQKTRLVDALILLKRQLPVFRARFFSELSDTLLSRYPDKEPVAGAPVRESLGNLDLSLVGKEEFEDWLALKVMITKAETAYRNHLLQLKMRLDAMGLPVGRGYANPLGPPLICNAFRDALSYLRLSGPAERLCLKTFEGIVLGELEAMYTELNEALIKAGILPNLNVSKYFTKPAQPPTQQSQLPTKAEPLQTSVPPAQAKVPVAKATVAKGELLARAIAKSRETPPPAAASLPSKPVEARSPGSLPIAVEESVRGHLQTAESSFRTAQQLFRLLEEGRSFNPASRSTPFPTQGGAPAYTNKEVFIHLGEVQTAPVLSDNEAAVDKTPLRERMFKLVQRQEENLKALTTQQDKALEVVDRFFASVLKNQKLTAVAKSQIKSLELPVLKIFLRNPDFFQESDSVPKQVINRIAQLGLKGGRTPRGIIERTNQLVTRIQGEYDNDPSVFEWGLGELNAMLERQNLLYRRNVERVAAAAEGQQKMADARLAVATVINQRVAGKRVPKALMTLINGGWRDLLSLTFIRQGVEGPDWSAYLSVLDTLISYAQNPDAVFNLAELLKIIQDGLAGISSNQIPSGHIRDELKRFLLKDAGSGIEWVDVPEAAEEEPGADIRQIQEAKQRGLQRWLARVHRMQPGDWLRMEQEGGTSDFIRLVWIGSHTSRYVFVNHQGMKVIDLDAVTLAAYLQKGLAVIEKDCERSVVDESLDEMVKDLYEQLNFVSSHDELTGLMQRKEFERQLSLFLASGEGKNSIGVILVSLDQFRLINDSAGLEAGDKALKDIARILRSLATDDKRVCRFGGDEFMLQVDSPAGDVAVKIADAIGNYRLKWQNNTYGLVASIGFVDALGGMVDVSEFLQSAENACREASASTDIKIRGFKVDEKLKARRDSIASQVAQLDRKLADEKILLRCQKIIPLHSKTRMGTQYEILLSVYDASGNLIPAGEFVRAAENYKRMQMVDRWVVGHALDWMKDNRRQIEAMGGITINLSGHSLNDEKLLEFIFERLTQYDVPLDKVCFEITEAAVITNTQDVSEFIHELQEYGCRFCLGNFGSGVSYQLLKQLPVDMIKVDGSYIRDVATDSNDRMMVRSMTEMAHYLGREIIGPHAETRATVDVLKELGVDYVQGYFIERPKSLANF
jgi:diguanylate cyclase (GGDEF)-like protein